MDRWMGQDGLVDGGTVQCVLRGRVRYVRYVYLRDSSPVHSDLQLQAKLPRSVQRELLCVS